MSKISEMIYLLFAQTGGEAADEVQQAAQAAQTTGMRWDGWLMLIVGILLLYGGLAWCLWIAAGRGKKDVWTKEEEDEPEAVIELQE